MPESHVLPFVLMQIASAFVVEHISLLLGQEASLLPTEISVLAIDLYQGYYLLAESDEFGGVIRRRLNRTLPFSEQAENCPICLHTHFLVWVGTVDLGDCEHSFCIHCLLTLSQRNLDKCPICRAPWNTGTDIEFVT